MKPIVSPKELAAAIGVSESSLKRWVDSGLVRASKTAGGHRRIAIGDAIQFIREIKAPLTRPDLLGLSELPEHVGKADPNEAADEKLYEHLREGRSVEARGLIVSLYLAGRSISELADGPIRTAMIRLGELWRHDASGIFVEHRATDICMQAVHQLRLLVEQKTTRMVAIGGAPTDDPYVLPSLLAATALAAEGVRAVNLGANTPIESLVDAVRQHRPRLVWISVSTEAGRRALGRGVEQLVCEAGPETRTVVLGGSAAGAIQLPDDQRIRVGRTLADLIHIARHLAGPPGA